MVRPRAQPCDHPAAPGPRNDLDLVEAPSAENGGAGEWLDGLNTFIEGRQGMLAKRIAEGEIEVTDVGDAVCEKGVYSRLKYEFGYEF